jgi:phosphoribosylamine--glycine ligase
VKILGVGGGAREHAIAERLALSRYNPRIYWISEWKNPGIERVCTTSGGFYKIGRTTDPNAVAEMASNIHADLVVIGPEEPNFHGVPDELEKRGIPCIGVSRELAIIEQSKAFLRALQWRYNIPGKLLFKTFRDESAAMDALAQAEKNITWMQNVVLKPARQAGGKGVKVVEDRHAYLLKEKLEFKLGHIEWLARYMKDYLDIEDKILIEECVWGPEYTLQCFSDGKELIGMPLVQDNKHAFEFDIGPETGGMGSFAGPELTLPFITQEEYSRSIKIIREIVNVVQDLTGKSYRGVVAGQMMLTEVEGPTVIEMYSRFGDPEALNVLAMLETDLLDIFLAIADGRLARLGIKCRRVASVVKVIAPEGYPDFRELARGREVIVEEKAVEDAGCKLYWGSAHIDEGGRILTVGSRVAEILGMGGTVEEASSRVDLCLNAVKLKGWNVFYRRDIGSREMLEKRSKLADVVRRLYRRRMELGTIGKRVDWIPGRGIVDPAEDIVKWFMKEPSDRRGG